MAAWPVVHWQVMSVTPQPDPGMADTRQGIFAQLAQVAFQLIMDKTYSAVGDVGEVRGLRRDNDERNRGGGNGGETHLDRFSVDKSCETRV